jgi:hypothetical protein
VRTNFIFSHTRFQPDFSPKEIDAFDYAAQQAAAGPAQASLDEFPHQEPNEPAVEVLRRLANRYLNQPGSQVDIRMEPGPAGGIRMVITLELAELL